jgi:hypothetical protein
MKMQVTIPRYFYEDHESRDLPSGEVIKQTKQNVTVEVDVETLAELWSDSHHYATFDGEDFTNNRGICLSARATEKAILRQYDKSIISAALRRAI